MHKPSLAAALAALLMPLAGCATTGAPEARPGLWKLADADTTIWLFGTVHALPKDYAWRSAAFEQAVRNADRLVIEVVLDRDPQRATALLAKIGRSPGLKPLAERIAPEKRAALDALIARSAVPAQALDGFETWAAALLLMGSTLRDLQVSASEGVEQQLENQFRAADKPIEGLETAEQQLGYFDALPEAEQVKLLESVLDKPGDAQKALGAMMSAWSRGKDRTIAARFDDELGASPALREALIDRRNAAWADEIARRMGEPGETLVAVGAGHLAGPSAVQTLLKAKGFTVTRVQ